jgi:hypothetical protein
MPCRRANNCTYRFSWLLMASLNLTMVVCGSVGLATEVADTVEGSGAFFFPNQFMTAKLLSKYGNCAQKRAVGSIPSAQGRRKDDGTRLSSPRSCSLALAATQSPS